ncbi:ankyrin repeat containing protein [Metarhizium acridum CQMa 102]|uniref:Ankyrin repeat containing protein n=1 Tax=Metarhizium acridum (strain CQMa 102) TaxID=655827 RepID=E9E4M9_METAQ|nr:ankyrin repeat containing protein [Metarhizium acridum CQMa 102]EFY89052.1 ankyrin repeat containing protein [Metarhizium acridum CQMa 102]
MAADEEHEGASIKELLIEACRRNNTDLLLEVLHDKPDAEITALLNNTTTPSFECDPINRLEGDTPLHTAIRWLNAEPPAQRAFGKALVEMMLEAGSNPRVRNKGGLTALQLVDPRNVELRQLIQQHEYTNQNAGDFITVDAGAAHSKGNSIDRVAAVGQQSDGDDDDDAEFSGSDEEERAEWERRRREKRK